MLALLSPAKKLNLEPLEIEPQSLTQPALMDDIEKLLVTTRQLTPEKLSSLMSISDKLAQLNHDRFQAFETPFTPENARPAVLTFAGDTYLGLQAATMNDEDLTFAQERIGILSGLYGLLRPLDLIQPYRLEMGTKLSTERGKNLYAFWGSRITDSVNQHTQGHADRTVVNLASKEYFSSIQTAALAGEVVTPVFKEIRGDSAKIISFFAKRARGSMARWIVDQRLDRPEGLKDFDRDGYRFDADRSRGNEFVFTRQSAKG